MKKSILTLVVTGALTFSLHAADAVKIGVAWEGKSSMADRVLAGFQEAMKAVAPEVEIEVQKELKDAAALTEIARRFDKEKKAMVLLRSTGAKCLAQGGFSISGFFGACNDPVELGVLKNSAAPEGKCSGVTYAIPYQTQVGTFLSVVPKAKRVLLIVEAGHPTTPLNQTGTKAACEKRGLQYSEQACKTKEEVAAALKDAEGKADLIILGSQALLIDNGGALAAAIKVPVVSYTEKPVADGALCGLVASDKILGTLLAESVVDVVMKGKAIKDVPVKVDPKPQLLINEETAKRLGLDISFEVLQAAKIISASAK